MSKTIAIDGCADHQIRKYSGPVFIVGMPRSGTKMLRDLLNQHPRIAIPSIETDFLPGLVKKYTQDKCFSKKELQALFDELIKFPYFVYLYENGYELTFEECFEACQNTNIAGIFEALIRCSTATVNNPDVIWGDKSPSYINHIPLLKELYPDARFIHIVRDVRDYVLSISKAWGKNKYRAAQRWADSLDTIENDIRQISDDVFVVRYEDFLDDHESILCQILGFLGLEFDECVMVLKSASENLGDTQGETRVVSENKNKYKKTLLPNEIKRLEALAGETLQRYGYEINYQGQRRRLSRIRQKYYQIIDAINMVRYEKDSRGYIGSILFHWRYFKATRGL